MKEGKQKLGVLLNLWLFQYTSISIITLVIPQLYAFKYMMGLH